jgi:hypothetical protein
LASRKKDVWARQVSFFGDAGKGDRAGDGDDADAGFGAGGGCGSMARRGERSNPCASFVIITASVVKLKILVRGRPVLERTTASLPREESSPVLLLTQNFSKVASGR